MAATLTVHISSHITRMNACIVLKTNNILFVLYHLLQTFSPTAGLYDNRDVYYTSAQADTLSPLVQQQQHIGAEGRPSSSHQQLNIQTSLLSSADDRQGELFCTH